MDFHLVMREMLAGLPGWFKALWLASVFGSLALIALVITALVKAIIYFS